MGKKSSAILLLHGRKLYPKSGALQWIYWDILRMQYGSNIYIALLPKKYSFIFEINMASKKIYDHGLRYLKLCYLYVYCTIYTWKICMGGSYSYICMYIPNNSLRSGDEKIIK